MPNIPMTTNSDIDSSAVSPEDALARLIEGNKRFRDGTSCFSGDGFALRGEQLAAGQHPHTVVVGCSDSRVPVEIAFDQGLGDLFVIRAAGNVMAPENIGSVEYATSQLGVRLIVVLGHTGCGAVHATLDHVENRRDPPSPNLQAVIARIQPAIEPLITSSGKNPQTLMDEAVHANIRHAAQAMVAASEILQTGLNDGQLLITCAEYDLATGRVQFFDD